MSKYQLMFVHHWIEAGRLRDRKSLGGLLGVYWTSDQVRASSGDQTMSKKHREAFIPLAGLLAPEVLQKTLDRVMDKSETRESQSMTEFGPGKFLGELPINEYQELFKQVQPEFMPQNGLPPISQEKPKAVPKAVKGLPPGIDLEKLKREDPELARHLDPDFQF